MPFGCVTLGEKKDYNQPSEVTDRYDLGQVIKTEEFCEIFRAKEKTTGKLYTCKKFLKRDGRKVRKAAKNEIIILKMVKHPNILQLVDVYITRKEYFIFLELATGREVFDWILDQGYYSERDTSNVIRQVLEAVAYLHSLKIVHRNLKLENLVYYNRLKNSKIVISDFHLAKLENGLIKEPWPLLCPPQLRRWWGGSGTGGQWTAGPLASSCTSSSLGTPPSMRRQTRMNMRTMTRTSSAKSWLGTMSLTTGTTSHRRIEKNFARAKWKSPRPRWQRFPLERGYWSCRSATCGPLPAVPLRSGAGGSSLH
ncbi:CaM kinase-like vesicle-associated, partial [Columba livia]